MAYGDPLSVTLPDVGVTTGPEYADDINEFLTALQDVVESKVTPAGIDISSDLSLQSGSTFSRIKDALGVSFRDQTGELDVNEYPTTLYFSGADLWVNDGFGNNIQVTSGGTLNISGQGGITGAGYGDPGVEVAWNSGSSLYEFWSDSTTGVYADIKIDDLVFSDGSSNTITLSAPSISADYSLTLPTALPASTSVVQVSSAGALSASPSANITTTGTVSAGVATVTGNATVGGTLGVTGAMSCSDVTASGTITGGGIASTGVIIAGGNITGDSLIYSAVQTLVLPACAFQPEGVPGSIATISLAGGQWTSNSTTVDFVAWLPLDPGRTIRSVSAQFSGTVTTTLQLQHVATATGIVATVASSAVTATTASLGVLAHVVLSTSGYQIRLQNFDAGGNGLRNVTVTYDT